MNEDERPKRGRPVTTGITPKRSLRVPDELWDDLTAAADSEDRDVATLTRDFYAWWLRRPGAKLPRRPAQSSPGLTQ